MRPLFWAFVLLALVVFLFSTVVTVWVGHSDMDFTGASSTDPDLDVEYPDFERRRRVTLPRT